MLFGGSNSSSLKVHLKLTMLAPAVPLKPPWSTVTKLDFVRGLSLLIEGLSFGVVQAVSIMLFFFDPNTDVFLGSLIKVTPLTS